MIQIITVVVIWFVTHTGALEKSQHTFGSYTHWLCVWMNWSRYPGDASCNIRQQVCHCFVGYFIKWVEPYLATDQTTETIIHMLVDNIVCSHGMPAELLSHWGQNLLSELMKQTCDALGMSKVNITAHHSHTDSLVEKINKTLRALIAKHVHTFEVEWDQHLQ